MWHRLKNLFFSLKTYNALSPDFEVRRQVNWALRQRSHLSVEEWFATFFEPQGIAQPIATFAYTHLEQYSGLDFGRVLPTDRLHEDLQWIRVCWFDWEINLYDDFYAAFEVDISDRLDELSNSTVGELVRSLDQAVRHSINPAVRRSPPASGYEQDFKLQELESGWGQA